MDYWILEKLAFKPKIICAEFNPWLGATSSLVIPKKLNFNYQSDMYYGASLRDWLGAAEYILYNGNPNVILCERGVSVTLFFSFYVLD